MANNDTTIAAFTSFVNEAFFNFSFDTSLSSIIKNSFFIVINLLVSLFTLLKDELFARRVLATLVWGVFAALATQ